MGTYTNWCIKQFGLSDDWLTMIGQIGTQITDIDGLDSIYFKNQDDAVYFLLVWG